MDGFQFTIYLVIGLICTLSTTFGLFYKEVVTVRDIFIALFLLSIGTLIWPFLAVCIFNEWFQSYKDKVVFNFKGK